MLAMFYLSYTESRQMDRCFLLALHREEVTEPGAVSTIRKL